MKIRVYDKGKKIIGLRLPVNKLTLGIAFGHLMKENEAFKDFDRHAFLSGAAKILKEFKHTEGGFTLVDVDAADGSTVMIKL
jgi:hypothetical protein